MGREDCGAEWRSHTPKEQRVKHSRMLVAGSLRDSGGAKNEVLVVRYPRMAALDHAVFPHRTSTSLVSRLGCRRIIVFGEKALDKSVRSILQDGLFRADRGTIAT